MKMRELNLARRLFRLAGAVCLLVMLLSSSIFAAGAASQKAKLPKPQVLGRGVQMRRDSATGELRVAAAPGDPTAAASAPVIRARVAMIEVGCTVTAADGTPVRGLGAGDFGIWEDGAAQSIASFDTGVTPASIALVFDASPSIAREQGEMREVAQALTRTLAPEDDVAVAAFADRALLLLPFSVTASYWRPRSHRLKSIM